MTRPSFFALLFLSLWTAACGNGGNGSFSTQPPPDVQVQISSGTSGSFNVAMSTSFQPAEWDYQFFTNNPGATTTLGNLMPQHVRLQAISQGVPQTSATTWDFSVVDAITQSVLSVGDHSPEFQIAKAPAFMYSGGDSSNPFLDLTFSQFAGYTQNLVKYYSAGGFNAADGPHISPAYPADKIAWWGIYNEPNINNSLMPSDYVNMYNTVVPAMQAADPSLKFVALELADFSGQPQAWVPPFVSGVTAQVDVMATHFYSSCDQLDTDAQVFNTVPGFVTDVQYFYSQMSTNAPLASVPVWVLENNVNADYANAQGNSSCNPNQVFVLDQRGSSPFFAAWRPYVFSQLGKAGVQALYHWDFDADVQFGEVQYSNDTIQLSYWVDYWLARMFPSAAGSKILNVTNSDEGDIEILAVQNPDGSVVIMLSNHSVQSPSDNNGPGAAHTIGLDVSALGSFSSGNSLAINADTNVMSGPVPDTFTPASQITVTMGGYGVTFLTLK